MVIDSERLGMGELPELASLSRVAELLDALLQATTHSETPAPTMVRLKLASGDTASNRWRSSLRLRVSHLLIARAAGTAAEVRQLMVGAGDVLEWSFVASAGPVVLPFPIVIEEGSDVYLRTPAGAASGDNVVYIVAYPERTPKGMNSAE